jgi:serine/threonine protein kinase
VTAKVDVRKHGERVGDIKPANVFIDNDRVAKVVNMYSSPKETSGFTKAKEDFENPHLDVLLAPEDFSELVNNAIDNKSNKQSEVFSIGATVISAGLLDDLRCAYKYKDKKFVSEEFNVIKDKWASDEKYSEIFKSIVLNLVNEDPSKRITIEDLFKFVSKYESSIKNKEQFIITHPPENLESHVSLVRSKVHI